MENRSPQPSSAPEMLKAINQLIKMNAHAQPRQKLCLLLIPRTHPQLVCFRKFKNNIQMTISGKQTEFESIIDDQKGVWKDVKLPPRLEKQLAPMLLPTIEITRPTLQQQLTKRYQPFFKFWQRYYESWSADGKSVKVLESYGKALTSGVPVKIMEGCIDKWTAWVRKLGQL